MVAREAGQPVDPERLAASVAECVLEVVDRQSAIGLDIINDGEASKANYATYIKHRLSGFNGSSTVREPSDAADFPEFAQRLKRSRPPQHWIRPSCDGPVALLDPEAVHRDIANVKAAAGAREATEVFLTAASPGVISLFLDNTYYPSHEAYLLALADAMKYEYQAIVSSGLLLQVDCPDLAMGRHIQFPEATLTEFRHLAAQHVEILNYALSGLPPERVRMHVCWGNTASPHHRDVPLADIIDIVLTAQAGSISLEGANPRHAHEWALFEEVKLPDGKILVPGVIDSTTNYIEHPELVAQRICNYARVVGTENVIAGTDCGLSSSVATMMVDPDIAWAKLESLVEGARLASSAVF
jgi:5-methyltetrahydropteroyltriglutamate--homocysteine methyltransferase